MKETKQQRHYNQLLNLYSEKPTLRVASAPSEQRVNPSSHQDITKNLLHSIVIASVLMIAQYVVGQIL